MDMWFGVGNVILHEDSIDEILDLKLLCCEQKQRIFIVCKDGLEELLNKLIEHRKSANIHSSNVFPNILTTIAALIDCHGGDGLFQADVDGYTGLLIVKEFTAIVHGELLDSSQNVFDLGSDGNVLDKKGCAIFGKIGNELGVLGKNLTLHRIHFEVDDLDFIPDSGSQGLAGVDDVGDGLCLVEGVFAYDIDGHARIAVMEELALLCDNVLGMFFEIRFDKVNDLEVADENICLLIGGVSEEFRDASECLVGQGKALEIDVLDFVPDF